MSSSSASEIESIHGADSRACVVWSARLGDAYSSAHAAGRIESSMRIVEGRVAISKRVLVEFLNETQEWITEYANPWLRTES